MLSKKHVADHCFQDYTNLEFKDRCLVGANFSRSLLRFSGFYRCDLQRANFVGADLTGAIISDCNLTDVLITSLKLPSKLDILNLLAYGVSNGFTFNLFPLLGTLIENPTAGDLLLSVCVPEFPKCILGTPNRSDLLREIERQIRDCT